MDTSARCFANASPTPSSPHMLSHSFSHSWYADIASGTERALVSCRGSLNANSASDVARTNQSRLMSWKVSNSSFACAGRQ
jgi:hypothetical protein